MPTLPDNGWAWLRRRADWFKLAAVPALNGGTGIDIVLRIDGTYFGTTIEEQQERLDRFARMLTDTAKDGD